MAETQRQVAPTGGPSGMRAMFLRSRQRRERQATIERLYGAIVTQARLPIFYTVLAAPDTVEGRFELIILHIHLLFRRLAREPEDSRAISQEVFDLFFEDMDASLRELGIGDLAVPRKMRAMGEAFYGRAGAYEAALAEPGDTALAAALHRNVYGGGGAEAAARRLAGYVRNADRALARQDAATIAGGAPVFPPP
jgi:cytochrome b pre-mRNA-processing protein 3